jgi:signal transduction histidine kinase
MIKADKARISQYVFNLVNNAVMFTKEGVISIKENKKKKSEDDDDDDNKEEFVVVSVKDSGIGIGPDIKARLFSKFSTKSYHGDRIGFVYFKEYCRSSWWQNTG